MNLPDVEVELTEDNVQPSRNRGDQDPQGIPWDRLRFSRESYRQQRITQYKNYTNVINLAQYDTLQAFHSKEVKADLTACRLEDGLFAFYRNYPSVRTSIIHFQLRNLLWATSSHDLFVVHNNCVKHWDLVAGSCDTVVDLTGAPNGVDIRGMGLVHISTMCAGEGLVVAGGFNGELVVATEAGAALWGTHVSRSDNCITNGLELAHASSGALSLLAANNDSRVRVLDVATGQLTAELATGWAANGVTMNPCHRGLAAVVGDDQDVFLFDMASRKPVASLPGHLDWSFAAAWHPAGHLLATGNQDCTARLWDTRYPAAALAVLPSTMGSIRTCRFSPDGTLLAVAEPADFVRVYDVASGVQEGQVLDMFGEVSGISFTPDSDALFVGIPDQVYNSTLCYCRRTQDESGAGA